MSILTARDLGDPSTCRLRRLLDVGGGSGAYDIELCRRNPGLSATVLDLPPFCEIAADKVAGRLRATGSQITPGDFLTDPSFPAAMTSLLSMIMHDWDPARTGDPAQGFAALPCGGLILIASCWSTTTRPGHPPAALMGLNMLVETVGRNYTPAEYSTWLRDTGFGTWRRCGSKPPAPTAWSSPANHDSLIRLDLQVSAAPPAASPPSPATAAQRRVASRAAPVEGAEQAGRMVGCHGRTVAQSTEGQGIWGQFPLCGRSKRPENAELTSVSAGQSGCGAPRRNRTGDPILTIDARGVHDAMQHPRSPHNRTGGKALPRVGT